MPRSCPHSVRRLTLDGQWQVPITIRGDAFYETTVTIPVAMH